MPYCPNCGAPIKPEERYCFTCGTKIAPVTEPLPRAREPAYPQETVHSRVLASRSTVPEEPEEYSRENDREEYEEESYGNDDEYPAEEEPAMPAEQGKAAPQPQAVPVAPKRSFLSNIAKILEIIVYVGFILAAAAAIYLLYTFAESVNIPMI